MAPPSKRSDADKRGGVLPLDAVYEILLRLPAKELCRLRVICRPWRSLLSDPHFIAAHSARHRGPLIVIGYSPIDRRGILCDIMDLSGRVVKRIPSMRDGTSQDWVISAQLDLVHIARELSKSCRLLNPATGAESALPERLAEEHEALNLDICDYTAAVDFGKVASTGDYKVLRVLDNIFFNFYHSSEQLCEVFTLCGSKDARWRVKRASPDRVDVRQSRTVIDGIVYFLTFEGVMDHVVTPKRIASFDLGTEEWRTTVRGPLIRIVHNAVGFPINHISLADLNDCLVVVHSICSSSMDLWFLMDFEKGLWAKQHSIQIEPSVQYDEYLRLHPLLVLNDGRILTCNGNRGLLWIYNPRTNTYTDWAKISPYGEIGLYTGNLLSLADGASR